MTFHNRHHSSSCLLSGTMSCSKTLLFHFLFLSFLSLALPYKAGYVEPIPGNTVMQRRGPTGTSPGNISSSRAAILQKLNAPRREITSSAQDSNASFNPGDVSSNTRAIIQPTEKRYHYRRPHTISRKQKVPSLVSSDTLAREEPPSLFSLGDDDTDIGSSIYYTTGSDATLSSVDVERYSQEHDLFEKQSAKSVDASSSPASTSSPSPPTSAATRSSNHNQVFDNKSNSSKKIDPSATASPPMNRPTLLPFASLATFHHIDNTLEKSSSNILSRIANFWKNLGGRNNTLTPTNNNNSNSSSSSVNTNLKSNTGADTNLHSLEANNAISSTNDENTYIEFDSDYPDSLSDDDRANPNTNRSSDSHHHLNENHRHHNDDDDDHRTSTNGLNRKKTESLQPSRFISIEDTNGRRISNTKQQYLSLEDEEDPSVGSKNVAATATATVDDHHRLPHRDHDPHLDHHHHQQQHPTSVEDYLTSEISAENYSDVSGRESFHDNLFHQTTTGTITAVIEKKDKKPHQDLMSSGSSRKQNVISTTATPESSAQATTTPRPSPPSVSFGPKGTSGVITKGDVTRAEKEKVWSIDSHFARNDLIESVEDDDSEYYYGMTIGGFLKRELWTIPLFVLASLNMILIILFEVYVLCRARGQSRRHLFLGQMLLFGLFLCSFLALMFAVHPSIVGCFVGRLGVGITYSLIFSVLMVKCVFLLSLDAGIYLPTSYQGILLFFAVMVQVAIDTQWVIMYPPFLQTVESGRSVLLQCGTSFIQLLYSLSYVGFLVLMVGFLAGRAAYKGVVENFKESVYILITAVVTIPVALSWTVAGWMLQGRHQDACVSFGLVAHSLTTFLIMFMPKGRQLASLDKEPVCFEDQEDQCSGYSPSFFHFKPSTKNYKTTLWGGMIFTLG